VYASSGNAPGIRKVSVLKPPFFSFSEVFVLVDLYNVGFGLQDDDEEEDTGRARRLKRNRFIDDIAAVDEDEDEEEEDVCPSFSTSSPKCLWYLAWS
jgi:hypothetical protein